MSNEEAIANLVGLMTSFHLEIKALPDDLKCTECKSVLKNACQVPCGCRFCHACIDDVISRGDQFCRGGSQECGATHLSTAVPDYRANKSVLKLTAKCPHAGGPHECPLAEMKSHLPLCLRQTVDYPFSPLYILKSSLSNDEMSGKQTEDNPFSSLISLKSSLSDDEMSGHLLQESRGPSETVANISRDVEMLKRELLLKDEQVKLITDENKSIKDEIKSMKDENDSIKDELISIKREKEVLCDRVRQLSEKVERDSAMVTAVTAAVASNRDEMEPVRGDIRLIRDQFDRMKCQTESIPMTVGLEQLDHWLIEDDVAKTDWMGWDNVRKTSGKFGLARAFQLSSCNSVSEGKLLIYLCIWGDTIISLLQWPFMGALTVTVADRDRHQVCSKQTRECQIEWPADNQITLSNLFEFRHAALRESGVHLERGVRLSCLIGPGAGQ